MDISFEFDYLRLTDTTFMWNLTNVNYFSFQAPRPSAGPHKLRECLPLIVFLRNRLKYALTYDEVKKILKQRLIKVDGKVRTDVTYPAGFMGKGSVCTYNSQKITLITQSILSQGFH